MAKKRVFKSFKNQFICVNYVIYRLSTPKSHPIMGPKNGPKMGQKWAKTPKWSFWAILGQRVVAPEKGTKSPILGGFGLFDH